MRPYFRRIFLIVVDSLGIGGAPDAAKFGDEGADTFGHIVEKQGRLNIPYLEALGFGILVPQSASPSQRPLGLLGILEEASASKDTLSGHWEMMGIETETPFQTFTDTGFPEELIKKLEEVSGREVIGNKAASGTVILDELGEQEINDGKMIVYTSTDSVLQICGNEETFDLNELYRVCEEARKLTMKPEWKVARVIARPFTGKKKGEFVRTANRRDYAVAPPRDTVLDALKDKGLDVIAVGKISDIFSGQGITRSLHSESSVHGMEQTIDIAKNDAFEGLCFTNLVDFDSKWGHRRDPEGYALEIERFDEKLGELLDTLEEGDLVMITADHGNDPTFRGTDHTRERVPLVMWSPSFAHGGILPVQESFGCVGKTIAENFSAGLPGGLVGESLFEYVESVTEESFAVEEKEEKTECVPKSSEERELPDHVFAHISPEDLYESACRARDKSYCPYSGFAVGAALLGRSGRIYTGCNVENAALGESICAERCAILKAVSEGERSFEAIAVAGGKAGQMPMQSCPPCGSCRQVMREFACGNVFLIITLDENGGLRISTLDTLLPESFGPGSW